MKIQAMPLTEAMAKEIATWKYDGDYAIYNLPSWEDMTQQSFSLCDEQKRKRFIGYADETEQLLGFVNLLDEGPHVFLGIGVKPTLCNKGLGKQILQLATQESCVRYPNKPIVLEVRSWNKRAVMCYESAGFKIIDIKEQVTHIGPGKFYVMKYS
ncbi:MAG TPA: GNAT family N-acetyltransferase [Firmicutes bacterium]|nr:GNAT family N-acetyltransferase [Bacillota bacterium]